MLIDLVFDYSDELYSQVDKNNEFLYHTTDDCICLCQEGFLEIFTPEDEESFSLEIVFEPTPTFVEVFFLREEGEIQIGDESFDLMGCTRRWLKTHGIEKFWIRLV